VSMKVEYDEFQAFWRAHERSDQVPVWIFYIMIRHIEDISRDFLRDEVLFA
jgi:hypothetical protein